MPWRIGHLPVAVFIYRILVGVADLAPDHLGPVNRQADFQSVALDPVLITSARALENRQQQLKAASVFISDFRRLYLRLLRLWVQAESQEPHLVTECLDKLNKLRSRNLNSHEQLGLLGEEIEMLALQLQPGATGFVRFSEAATAASVPPRRVRGARDGTARAGARSSAGCTSTT